MIKPSSAIRDHRRDADDVVAIGRAAASCGAPDGSRSALPIESIVARPLDEPRGLVGGMESR